MSSVARNVVLQWPDERGLADALPAQWAAQRLGQALASKASILELRTDDTVSQAAYLLRVNTNPASATGSQNHLFDAPESFAIIPGSGDDSNVIAIDAADVRGLTYALTELADRVQHADSVQEALALDEPIVEQPANPLRGIMRLFTSDVEDKSWFYDREFWKHYLDEIATHRFNRFHLAFGIGYDFLRDVSDVYFVFAYPYLLSVPGYNVRVSNLSDDERKTNLETLKFIGEEVARRGLDFQLGLWTQQYEWTDSPNPDQTIEGLDAETHPYYCRDALKMLLQEVPSITGVTLRVHGESGIPEGNNHLWKIILDGVAECGREVEIDLHPKGVGQEMIDIAINTGMPTSVSPKYIAEHIGVPAHQAAIRPCEQETANTDHDGFIANLMNLSHGELRFTRYSYANFFNEDRKYDVLFRIWPGTQRLLLWGSPRFAAGYGRFGTFGGSRGIEIFEPLSFKGRRGTGLPGGRNAYADESLKPAKGDYEKYEFTYRLYGRHLFNPDTDSDVWERYLRSEFGDAGGHLGEALAEASEILPLITTAYLPSAANNRYWPEIYTNMPIVDPENRFHPYVDTVLPPGFATASPGDAEMFLSVQHFVDEVLSGERSGRYSPLTAANWLEQRAHHAEYALKKAHQVTSNSEDPNFRRWSVDIAIQIGLGRFFAHKLRAGVGYTLYERTGSIDLLWQAVADYRSARDAWKSVIEHGKVYRDDITVGERPFLRGHWKDRLEAIELDLSDMEAKLQEAERAGQSGGVHPTIEGRLLNDFDSWLTGVRVSHEPPTSFARGKDVPLSFRIEVNEDDAPNSVTAELRYRRVNQGESNYQVAELEQVDCSFKTRIPAEYGDSPFSLMYYVAIRDGSGKVCLYPGFDESLATQPYYVVRQAPGK